MDFARKQLEKYGWKEGKGLGKNENGISTALKPKLKFDNSGVGHDAGEQFNNNWWERVFNNASKNIDVQVDTSDVKLRIKSEDSVEITTKNYSVRELHKNKNVHYGAFIMTEKISETGVERYKSAKTPNAFQNIKCLTDEELFAACGGRTAHKGARHGLNLSGKLARIEKQEKILLKKMKNVSLTEDATKIHKKMKKLHKMQKEDNCGGGSSGSPQVTETEDTVSTKKKKKKRKSVSFNDEAVIKYYTPDPDTSFDSTISSRDEQSSDSNCNDEGIERDVDSGDVATTDNYQSFKEARCNISDLSKSERRKLKKKRKLQDRQTTKTALFLKEVLGEPSDDVADECADVGKKRKVSQNEYPKKKKRYSHEKGKNRTKREEMMNTITHSLDNLCKISDKE